MIGPLGEGLEYLLSMYVSVANDEAWFGIIVASDTVLCLTSIPETDMM